MHPLLQAFWYWASLRGVSFCMISFASFSASDNLCFGSPDFQITSSNFGLVKWALPRFAISHHKFVWTQHYPPGCCLTVCPCSGLNLLPLLCFFILASALNILPSVFCRLFSSQFGVSVTRVKLGRVWDGYFIIYLSPIIKSLGNEHIEVSLDIPDADAAVLDFFVDF